MRLLLTTIVILGLGVTGVNEISSSAAASGSPQGNLVSSTEAMMSPNRETRRSLPPQKVYENAIADCMRMWDAGTHMTKREWLRTCKRFEARVEGLKLDAK